MTPALYLLLLACSDKDAAPPPPDGGTDSVVDGAEDDTGAAGEDSGPADSADPDSADPDSADPDSGEPGDGGADDPLAEDCAGWADYNVTWSNWAQGFFTTWCQPCHSEQTPERNGAPEGVNFDTYDQVAAQRELIWWSVMEEQRMPTGGGMTDDEYAFMAAFLCGIEG
jgi:hypothetical protein